MHNLIHLAKGIFFPPSLAPHPSSWELPGHCMTAKPLPQDRGPSRFPKKSQFREEGESFALVLLSLILMGTWLNIPHLALIAFKHP